VDAAVVTACSVSYIRSIAQSVSLSSFCCGHESGGGFRHDLGDRPPHSLTKQGAIVAQELAKRFGEDFGCVPDRDFNLNVPMHTHTGLDSLVAVELWNWFCKGDARGYCDIWNPGWRNPSICK
jgi:hypothetical protein